jgi:iron-sulfur cluster assembly accessory protein
METVTTGIALTDTAAIKVKELLDRETGEQALALRVAVQPGGCSGLRYALYFDDQITEKDVVSEFGAVKVVVDKMSAPYLKGASVDYVDTLQQSGFTINNPNAQSSCACGDSFH